MTTTASRSCLWLRKQGFNAEVVEHRRGRFMRKDLFDVADVLAFKKGYGILMVQAYDKYKEKEHRKHNFQNPMIAQWLSSGGRFSHHIWYYSTKKKRKYWHVKTKEIGIWTKK